MQKNLLPLIAECGMYFSTGYLARKFSIHSLKMTIHTKKRQFMSPASIFHY